MKRWISAGAAVCVLAACGGDDSGGAGEVEGAVRSFVEYRADGQHGRLWDSLHPAQQDFVDRNDFIECEGERVPAYEIEEFDVKETFEEPIEFVGSDGEVDSTAVTITVTASLGGEQATDTQTTHAIDVDGEWTWILKDADAEAYRDGDCPSA